MSFAVFKPQYTRTNERVSHHSPDTPHVWHLVELVPVLTLTSSTVDGAMVEAKRAGHRAPILGEVA